MLLEYGLLYTLLTDSKWLSYIQVTFQDSGLGRLSLYSLGIAQCDGLSSHPLAGGLTCLGVQRAFPLSNLREWDEIPGGMRGREGDEIQSGDLKSRTFETFQGKGSIC